MNKVVVGSPPKKPRILLRSSSRSSSKENRSILDTPKTSSLFFKPGQNSAMILKQNTQFINTFLSPQKDLMPMKTFQSITSYSSNGKEVKPIRLFQECETQKMSKHDFQPINEHNEIFSDIVIPTQNSVHENFSKPFELLPFQNHKTQKEANLSGITAHPGPSNLNLEPNFKKKVDESITEHRTYCSSAKKYDEKESDEKARRKFEDLLQNIKKETEKHQKSIAEITFLRSDGKINRNENVQEEKAKREIYLDENSRRNFHLGVENPKAENYQRENHFKKSQAPFIRQVNNQSERNQMPDYQADILRQELKSTKNYENLQKYDQKLTNTFMTSSAFHNKTNLIQNPILVFKHDEMSSFKKEYKEPFSQKSIIENGNIAKEVKIEAQNTSKSHNLQASEIIFNKILTGKISVVQDKTTEKNNNPKISQQILNNSNIQENVSEKKNEIFDSSSQGYSINNVTIIQTKTSEMKTNNSNEIECTNQKKNEAVVIIDSCTTKPIFENKSTITKKDNQHPLKSSQCIFPNQTLKNSIQMTNVSVSSEKTPSLRSVSIQQDVKATQQINNGNQKMVNSTMYSSTTSTNNGRSSSTKLPEQHTNIDNLVEECLSKTRNVLENISTNGRDPLKICSNTKKNELPAQISKEINNLNTPVFKTKIDQMFYNALNRSESLISKHYTMKNGTINPKGQSKINDEDSQFKYNGDYLNNLKHGFGLLTNNLNQKIYIGDWKVDKYHGQGVLYNINIDSTLEGEIDYKNVIMEKLPWKMYEGEFQNGEFHGMGSLSFVSGERLNGKFLKGKFNGEGTYYQSDGEIIMGIWEDNVLKKVL